MIELRNRKRASQEKSRCHHHLPDHCYAGDHLLPPKPQCSALIGLCCFVLFGNLTEECLIDKHYLTIRYTKKMLVRNLQDTLFGSVVVIMQKAPEANSAVCVYSVGRATAKYTEEHYS